MRAWSSERHRPFSIVNSDRALGPFGTRPFWGPVVDGATGVTKFFVRLQDRRRANLLRIAAHEAYVVTLLPDGAMYWDPAEVLTVSERKLLQDTALQASIAADREAPERLVTRDRPHAEGHQPVAELRFGRAANDMLSELETEAVHNAGLLECLHAALDDLEAGPQEPWCRRRQYQHLGVWGVSVVYQSELRLIIWSALSDDVVVVHAIVPAPIG